MNTDEGLKRRLAELLILASADAEGAGSELRELGKRLAKSRLWPIHLKAPPTEVGTERGEIQAEILPGELAEARSLQISWTGDSLILGLPRPQECEPLREWKPLALVVSRLSYATLAAGPVTLQFPGQHERDVRAAAVGWAAASADEATRIEEEGEHWKATYDLDQLLLQVDAELPDAQDGGYVMAEVEALGLDLPLRAVISLDVQLPSGRWKGSWWLPEDRLAGATVIRLRVLPLTTNDLGLLDSKQVSAFLGSQEDLGAISLHPAEGGYEARVTMPHHRDLLRDPAAQWLVRVAPLAAEG